MGETDYLRRHDNVVGAFRHVGQADIFSAVMQDHGNLQQKSFSLSQSVYLLHPVKNLQRHLFHIFDVRHVALVALGDIPGSRKNILVKIVFGFNQLIAHSVIVAQAVIGAHLRKPDGLRPQLFHQAAAENHGGHHKGSGIRRNMELLRHLIRVQTDNSAVSFLKFFF